MSQCVPNWDLDENSTPLQLAHRAHSNSTNSNPLDVPSLDYEVAELTWENGQLAMHGLGPPRVANKPTITSTPTTWEKPRAGGTLEAIVNQATRHPHLKSAANGCGNNVNEMVPWFDHNRVEMVKPPASASVTVTMDALVPCNNNTHHQEHSSHVPCTVPGCSTRVGSCSGAAPGARVGPRVEMKNYKTMSLSVSESATCGGGRDSRQQVTVDTYERELGGTVYTSTSLGSPENTSSGKDYAKTSADDDSVCHSRSQREAGDHDKGNKKSIGKSSISTKRSRAAAIHNQSERKRRDKINQRMKTLQKLVPNSSKTDKASMLDEVIEYLKQLQAQVQMISRMNMSPMMLAMQQQQLQMSMMGMGMGMGGMGMGIGVMDLNSISRAAGMQSIIPPAASFMPVASWPENPAAGDRLPTAMSMMPDPLSTFLACQSQPMNMDAYSRLQAALYQQFQQQHGTGAKD